MKVTQDAIVDRQAVLHIDVEEPELEEHLTRAYRRLVGRVAIPGFRKGKAPRSIFERQYGRDRLVEEALESLVPDAVSKAIEDQGLEATSTPRVSVEEREPLPKLRATVPLTPVVELGDYSTIHFDDRPEEVTDDRVESVISRVREGQAAFEAVERPLAMQDMAVLAALDCKVGDRTVLTGKDAEYVLAEDSTYPAPGFAKELGGMKAGESRVFTLRLPDNFRDTAAAGKDARFDVTLSGVKEKHLPELDDEFAKSLGEGVQTLDELRTKVRGELEKQAAEAHQNLLEGKAMDALVGMTKFDIPPLLIDHEAQHLLEDQQEALARYKISFQDYMQTAGKSGEQVVNETRDSAGMRVRRYLALQELIKALEIAVTDDEIRAETDRLRASARNAEESAAVETDSAQENIRAMLLRRRALEKLVESAKSATPSATPAAEAAAPAAEG